MVTLEPGAGQAIKSFLAQKGLQKPLRIHLQSYGCREPAFALSLDTIDETDEIEEVDGLTFVISPETHRLVGTVPSPVGRPSGKKGLCSPRANP